MTIQSKSLDTLVFHMLQCPGLLIRSNQQLRSHRKPREYYSIDVFFYFSGDFNTIQLHILVQKLLNINVSSSVVHWMFNCLRNRPQFISLNGITSDVCSSTGAPQGTVLAPFLFTLYTADCRHTDCTCPTIKFTHDSDMIWHVNNDDVTDWGD